MRFAPARKSRSVPMATRAMPRITPMRTEILISQPIRCRPKRMISAPAMGASRLRFFNRNWPTALAVAPMVMNTAEKPITNAEAELNSFPVEPWPSLSWSTPTPKSMETYPGTRGKTHGERNEINPATNTNKAKAAIGFLVAPRRGAPNLLPRHAQTTIFPHGLDAHQRNSVRDAGRSRGPSIQVGTPLVPLVRFFVGQRNREQPRFAPARAH